MGSFNVKASGAWRPAKTVHVRSGGSWRAAKEVWIRSGGAWRKAWAAIHTVTVSPTSISAYGTGSGYVSSDSATVTASGGSGGFSYAWEFVSGHTSGQGQVYIGSSNDASSSVYITGGEPGTQRVIVIRCKVTASDGQIVYSPNVTFYMNIN